MSSFKIFEIAGTGMSAQSVRLNTTASNLANADSVVGADGQPYRSKQVVFKATPVNEQGGIGVRVTQVVESAAPMRQIYDPANPAADALIPDDKKRINPVDPANMAKQIALDMEWYAANYGAALDEYTKIISA